jgi:hypothetical protein
VGWPGWRLIEASMGLFQTGAHDFVDVALAV